MAHHQRGVALGDNPHVGNFVLRRPLAEGLPEVVAVDHDHAVTAASPQELEEDWEAHIAFIRDLVRRRLAWNRQLRRLHAAKCTRQAARFVELLL